MEFLSEIDCAYCPKHSHRQRADTPIECTLSDGQPCLACTRQSELRAQIEDTKKLLDKLIEEELEARKSINRVHDPIHRLPAEITSHIFCFTLPDFRFQKRTEAHDTVKARSETGILTLGAVCQLWRKIAWSASQLWSDVMLTLHYPPTDNMIDVVKEWLERSRRSPLSIRLYLADNSGWSRDDQGNLIESIRTQDFVESFNKHSDRWQDLSIQSEYILLDRLTQHPKGAPALKSLQLLPRSEKEPWNGFRIEDPTHNLNDAIEMGYRQLQDMDFSWNDLTHATIDRLIMTDCIQLLLVAPALVNLRLEKIGNGPELQKPNTPLVHNQLRALDMTSPNYVAAIFDNVTLPSLEQLGIHGFWPHEFTRFPFDSVLGFLTRSSCPLTSFSLEKSDCEEQEIFNLFDTLPASLEHLTLNIRIPGAVDRDHNLPVLFSHLARVPASTIGMPSRLELFPNLETFKYYVFKGTEVPWNLLPNIPRPVSGSKRPFKELSIIERYFHSSDLPLLITKSQNIVMATVHDLIGLQEDGVDLYLPHRVSRQDLLALLEDE